MRKRLYRGSTNPIVASLIQDLRRFSSQDQARIWRKLSQLLQRPSRKRAAVNLSKIERYTNEGEAVVIPGKVLASGDIKRPITVAAIGFSKIAEEKILKAKGKTLSIRDLHKENPKGSKVRILT